ncbi:MAG: protein-disulfide reductase DsbD domain-containing protein, partial [Alphaproteobacteria bacterium]
LLLALPVAAPAMAGAGASPWASTEQSQVRLISAMTAVGDRASLSLGLHIRLEPGWKTYWRSPGDAGFPTLLDWSGSANLAAAELHWPAPKRFRIFGLETFGYVDEVVLPVTLSLARPGQAAALKVRVDYAICKDICIPHEAELTLDLGAGAARASPYAGLIERYLSRVPARGPSAELAIEGVTVRGAVPTQVLEVSARARRPFVAPDLIVEGPAGYFFGAAQVSFRDAGLGARLAAPVTTRQGLGSLAGQALTLILIDGERAVEREVAPSAAD